MVPAAAADEVWEGAKRLSPKSNALAAWRFEPCPMLNESSLKVSSSDAWIAQASQRDMESLTLALQRELCSTRNKNIIKIPNSHESMSNLQGGSWSSSPPRAWRPSVKTECQSTSDVSSPLTSSETDAPILGSSSEEINALNTLNLQQSFGGLSYSNSKFSQPNTCSNSPSTPAISAATAKHPVLNGATGGKVSKRRSRAANKSPITFLNADPAHFRAMVQEVTGIPLNPNATARLWNPSGGVGVPLLRPQPKRPSSIHNIQGLPTLDTSALLIEASQARIPPITPPSHFSAPANTEFVSLNSLANFTPSLPPNGFPPKPAITNNNNPDAFIGGELLTQKLRAACMQSLMKSRGYNPNNVSFHHQPQGFYFADIKSPNSGAMAESFLLENEADDNSNYGNPVDSWLNSDGILTNSKAELTSSSPSLLV